MFCHYMHHLHVCLLKSTVGFLRFWYCTEITIKLYNICYCVKRYHSNNCCNIYEWRKATWTSWYSRQFVCDESNDCYIDAIYAYVFDKACVAYSICCSFKGKSVVIRRVFKHNQMLKVLYVILINLCKVYCERSTQVVSSSCILHFSFS